MCIGVRIFYDVGNKTLAELLDFPLETDSSEVVRQKHARQMGEADQALPGKISDAPPPKVVPKHLTGRIHSSWKGNDK